MCVCRINLRAMKLESGVRILRAMALVVGLVGSLPAAAEDLFAPQFAGLKWGMKGDVTTSPRCLVTITIDQPTFSTHIPDMVQAHIFSDRVGPEMANSAPHYLLNALEAVTAPTVVEGTFTKYPEIKSCHFQYKYINPDIYGNDKEYDMVSFEITRSIVEKVNWRRFNANNLMKITNNFRADPDYSKQVQQEALAAMMTLRGG